MVKYGNGKIYKLVNDVDDEIYIGSTCRDLSRRKSDHKSKAKTDGNRHVYSHLNEVLWENVHIILIEAFPCNNKTELEKRERYWIDQLKPILNKVIPTRTDAEYRVDNKQKIRAKDKEYHDKNKDKLNKAYICACGGSYTHIHKSHHFRTSKHQDFERIIPKWME